MLTLRDPISTIRLPIRVFDDQGKRYTVAQSVERICPDLLCFLYNLLIRIRIGLWYIREENRGPQALRSDSLAGSRKPSLVPIRVSGTKAKAENLCRTVCRSEEGQGSSKQEQEQEQRGMAKDKEQFKMRNRDQEEESAIAEYRLVRLDQGKVFSSRRGKGPETCPLLTDQSRR